MIKAKKLGVLALAGLVILSAFASAAVANGQKGYYVRGPSGVLTERVANIDTDTSAGQPSWRFPAFEAETPQDGVNNRYSMMDGAREYLNKSTLGWQSRNPSYRIFPPGNGTIGQVPEGPTIPGWSFNNENDVIGSIPNTFGWSFNNENDVIGSIPNTFGWSFNNENDVIGSIPNTFGWNNNN
ncbi:hypothetical protein C5S35_08530 [Candidatus Methanophagaceae archaeon]|nr:hypothetical protein C5S35_08530 [Methanophagales archaeon]